MTYSELVSTIKAACFKSAGSGTFAKGRRPDAGFASVNESMMPLMFMFYPEFSGSGRSNEIVRISMLFLKQDDVNKLDEDREAIQNEMKSLSDTFFINLIQAIDTPGSTAQYNNDKRVTIEDRILAGTFSGVGLSFTITTKAKQC